MEEIDFLNSRGKKRRRSDNKNVVCVVCNKQKRGIKTISTENGRNNIKSSSQWLKDRILDNKSDDEIVYHKTCYKTYVLRGKRVQSVTFVSKKTEKNNAPSHSREKRQRNKSEKNKEPKSVLSAIKPPQRETVNFLEFVKKYEQSNLLMPQNITWTLFFNV